MEWNGMECSGAGRGGKGDGGRRQGGICVDVCVSEAYGDVFKRIAVFVAGIREFVIAIVETLAVGVLFVQLL
jgi:hypothetical protein